MAEREAQEALEQALQAGPFKADWGSLQGYRAPAWFSDAKFGIFIHWGVYAVPAYDNEWYSRNMYQPDTKPFAYHRTTYGPQDRTGYKDLIPLFRAEQFDPREWISLCKQAGARYVVPVAEHHDGFAMYNSSFSRWNAVQMGPRRDVIGELAAEARAQGLTFGLSYHRAEHWWFFDGGLTFPSDVTDPTWADFYGPPHPRTEIPDTAFLNDWLMRAVELVELYRPQQVYFDWWIEEPAFQPYLQRFAAYYYNRAAAWHQGVVINYKHVDRADGSFAPGTAVFDIERGQASAILPEVWQSDTSINRNSWCHVGTPDYKKAEELIGDLADVVSKNGTLLLNIGPRADGTIAPEERSILLEIGRWLEINGEAIYATRPWKIFGEGPTRVADGNFSDAQRRAFTSQDIRFTARDEALYAIFLAWPASLQLTLTSLATTSKLYPQTIDRVELLGSEAPLDWSRDASGLHVQLPPQQPSPYAGVLKIRQS